MTKILVTGATGNVGRELVALLPGSDVRVLSRSFSPDRAGGVVGDLAQPESLVDAVDGVDTVFLIWPFLTADAAPAVLELLGAGRRVVYLSSSGVGEGHGDPINRMHASLEERVEKYSTEWAILRSNTIASNARGWAGQIRSTGVVRGPDLPATAVVHERDLATVAVRALAGELNGQRVVLTGPEVLSRAEQVAALAAALGRELRFEPVAVEDARAQLLADGRPSALVEALLASAGRPPSTLITSTIEDVTGVAARTFTGWAEEHADEFR
jgi:uncharacterized protein YbjT (DUF2867 family)